jgi:NAD+ synthase
MINEKRAKENYKKVVEWLEKYKEATACSGVVLGISGGKDSTTVAMLAKKVWGDSVIGVLMPNGEQSDIADSYEIVKALGLRHYVVNINDAFSGIVGAIEKSGAPKIEGQAKTNIPPRLRMTTLYAIAQSFGYRVIGTGNASEIYIGWTTKWGDGGHDLNPIAGLTCTEVMELGSLLSLEFGLDGRLAVKAPSDGLTGRTDEDNFGFTYKELDDYILYGIEPEKEKLEKIKRMHAFSAHKRKMPTRYGVDE